jgi:hypothetical protein
MNLARTSTLTYDEALTKHIGQFGPGQWLALVWASTHEIANAAALFIWVFLTVDPIASHSWKCTQPTDAQCAAALHRHAFSYHLLKVNRISYTKVVTTARPTGFVNFKKGDTASETQTKVIRRCYEKALRIASRSQQLTIM